MSATGTSEVAFLFAGLDVEHKAYSGLGLPTLHVTGQNCGPACLHS